MAKYNVTLYYHTSVTIEVDAEDDYEAIDKAYSKADSKKYNRQLLDNLSEDGEPDAERL